jgi:hypothetical protein
MSLDASATLDAKFRSIGIDRDYSALDLDLAPDVQGWGFDSPVFERVLTELRPSLLVEIGTWKGASVIHMAKLAAAHGLDTQFICIDTWLGSNDRLWIDPEYRSWLMLRGGYPTMFRQFIANIVHAGVAGRVFPLPMTSSSASYLLKHFEIAPDAVYIDAGHEEDEVYIDLKLYYPLVRPGGIIFGDDYSRTWPSVVAAVNRFAAERRLQLECGGKKYLFEKPAE